VPARCRCATEWGSRKGGCSRRVKVGSGPDDRAPLISHCDEGKRAKRRPANNPSRKRRRIDAPGCVVQRSVGYSSRRLQMARFRILVSQLRRTWASLLVLTAFAFVVFFHRDGDRLKLGIPYVYAGDELHYLVGLNSVLWDGDVELGNNYTRAEFGHVDSGVHRAGQIIDHHTYLRSFTGSVYQQSSLFEAFRADVDRDAAGRQRPRAKRIPAQGVLPTEYAWHPTYPFYLVAPVLSLLPRTAVEPVVIVLISALMFLAALRFRELCTTFVPSALHADLTMLAVFVGTPVLYYSRALFPESLFVILLVFAWHSCVVRGRWLTPGFCLMLAAALKPPAALLAVPVILLMAHRNWLKAVAIFSMVCIGVAFAFFELRVLKGVLQSGTKVDPGRLVELSNLAYMPYANLFNKTYGLFVFAPVLAVSLIGWIPLSRRFPREAGAVLAGVALNFGFPCLLSFYGGSYGGRYQVPYMPLLGLGLVGIWFYQRALRTALLLAFGLLLVVSAAINLKGTLWST